MSFPQLDRLVNILLRLRGPDGCPWDREQDLASAARYLSDEVHEYVDAAHAGDLDHLRKELADLLYMVAFNWLILSEQSDVTFDDLARDGADKLERRHAHLFAGGKPTSAAESNAHWNAAKAREKAEAGQPDAVPSSLKDLSPSASPLRQALLYGKGAAETSFDWPAPEDVLRKLHEELDELAAARHAGDQHHVEEELGDVLFAAVQLCRKLGVDPDVALRRTNAKFARRFRTIEADHDHDPQRLRDRGLHALHAAWEEVKARERADQG